MRYVIYGAGAIGGSIGGRLVEHGHEVVLIARGAHLEAMRRDGMRLRTPEGDTQLEVTAVGHPSEIAFRSDDVVILTMKSQDTLEALEALRAAAGDEVPVICAQNGVENERLAARRFANVYGMLVQMVSTHLEPGEVLAYGSPVSGVLDAGRYPRGTDAVIEQVCADISASHMLAEPNPDIMRMKYAKLIYINLANAVQAICPPAEDWRELLHLLTAEARAVYEAAGIDCATREEFLARTSLAPGALIPGEPRGGGSTWQSLVRGASTVETDYLNGEIVLLGRLHGVPAPANRLMQTLSWSFARERRAPGSMSVAEVLALARVGDEGSVAG